LLRFAAFIKSALDSSGQTVAIVARSGLDLSRFNLRYSHGGISLQASPNAPWSVRQLYYDCDTAQARLFDQGISGFVLGSDNPDLGFFSAVLLPTAAAEALLAQTLDKSKALQALHGRYSANAYAWSLRYQNCNQWLVELMATAYGGLPDGPDLRARAQAWLRDDGYRPAAVDAGSHAVMFAAGFVPWLRLDDRPEAERHSLVFQVSLPVSIEAYALQRWPEARRIELCHADDRVVVRQGGPAIADGCVPAPGDRVLAL
jgi:hypothetical protein